MCGQCHVEYYFRGPEKRLTYPWSKGLKVEQIADYYDEAGFKDWVHAESGAPVLKAQHPEFEMWNQGIHARSGVACADCHMPYTRVGALKISDHHVRSPLLNVNHACQSCHRWPEAGLTARVEATQERVFGMRNQAMDALVALIDRRPQGCACSGRCGGPHRGRPEAAAALAVLPGLRRGRELHRLPRAAGGTAHPRTVDRSRSAGPARPAARAVGREVRVQARSSTAVPRTRPARSAPSAWFASFSM